MLRPEVSIKMFPKERGVGRAWAGREWKRKTELTTKGLLHGGKASLVTRFPDFARSSFWYD